MACLRRHIAKAAQNLGRLPVEGSASAWVHLAREADSLPVAGHKPARDLRPARLALSDPEKC